MRREPALPPIGSLMRTLPHPPGAFKVDVRGFEVRRPGGLAPQHERVLRRVRVVVASHARHPEPEPLVQPPRIVVRPPHFQRGARARRAARLPRVTRASSADPSPRPRNSGRTAMLLMCTSSRIEPRGACSRRRGTRGVRSTYSRLVSRLRNSDSYIARVHGRVNDSASTARTPSRSAGPRAVR